MTTQPTPWRSLTLADIERLTTAVGDCWLLDAQPRGTRGRWSGAQVRRASRARTAVRALAGVSGEWECGISACVNPAHIGDGPRWQALSLAEIREHCRVLPRSGCWLVTQAPPVWGETGPVWTEAQCHRAQRVRRRVRALIGRDDAVWRCEAPCVCPEHATLRAGVDATRHVSRGLYADE